MSTDMNLCAWPACRKPLSGYTQEPLTPNGRATRYEHCTDPDCPLYLHTLSTGAHARLTLREAWAIKQTRQASRRAVQP